MTTPDWVARPDPSVHTLPFKPAQAARTQQEMAATVQFWLDSFIGQIAIAFGGIEILGWKPFEFLIEWGEERIAAAVRNFKAAMYANTQLSVITGTGLASDVTGGVSLSEPFSGSAATNLGSNFTRFSSGAGAGGFGPDGSGLAVWTKSGGNDRFHRDVHNTSLATDTQIAMTVIADPPQASFNGGDAYTYLCVRGNFDLTTYVYLRIGWGDVEIGCVVSGSTTVYGGFTTSVDAGNVWHFLIGTSTDDREMIVKRNGLVLWQYTDTGDVSQLGPTQRRVGLISKAANRANLFGFIFTDQTVPAALDSWSVADRLPASV